jgi:hypothetical protein
LLLDCGPAFKRQFLLAHDRLGTRTLDAVLLTQGDSHTLLGLNDLREVQHANGKDNRRAGNESADASLPVYGAADALARAQSGFPFLFPEPSAEQKKTLVGQLRRTEPVERRPGARVYLDLPFLPAHVVPVGALGAEGLVGYSLGRDDGCVVLLPSPELPQDSLDWLQKRRLSLLVLGGTETEADVRTALRVVNAVTPERAVLLGAGCTLRHEEVVECLAAEPAPCPVELAYDGMCVDVRLYNTEGFSAPASPNLQPVDLLKPVEDVSPSGSQDSTHTTSSTETSEHGEASAKPVLAFLSPLIGGHDNGKANGYCAPCPNGVNGHMPEFTL